MKKIIVSPKAVFLSIAVFYGFMFVAWALYPYDYSLISNNISRLGRPSYNPDGYIWSFIGTVGSALLMLGYYLTLPMWKNGDPKIDRGVNLIMGLGIFGSVCLISLAIFNSDFKLAHKILGASYFTSDVILMLVAIYMVLRHPKVDNALVVVCALSAILDLLYLQSNAKWSWAEWGTVALSYTAAVWLAVNSQRLQGETHLEEEAATV